MSYRNEVDEREHVLVIEAKYDDGEIDWYIEHLDTCPKEEFLNGIDKSESMEYYICRAQACLDGNSLDDIEDWRELPIGRYDIKSYYEYIPGDFGGSYGAEHEIGLFLSAPELQT